MDKKKKENGNENVLARFCISEAGQGDSALSSDRKA